MFCDSLPETTTILVRCRSDDGHRYVKLREEGFDDYAKVLLLCLTSDESSPGHRVSTALYSRMRCKELDAAILNEQRVELRHE